jgi:L-lactate permease
VFGPAIGGYKGAAAMYLLMPAVAGILASVLSLAIFLIKAKSIKPYDVTQSEENQKWLRNEDEPEKVGADIGTRFAQTQLSDMSSPFLQK